MTTESNVQPDSKDAASVKYLASEQFEKGRI